MGLSARQLKILIEYGKKHPEEVIEGSELDLMIKLNSPIDPQEKMTLEHFREFTKNFDDNLTTPLTNRFELICNKCKSKNIQVMFRNKIISQGSSYTGCWTAQEEGLLFKCISCGNALVFEGE